MVLIFENAAIDYRFHAIQVSGAVKGQCFLKPLPLTLEIRHLTIDYQMLLIKRSIFLQ